MAAIDRAVRVPLAPQPGRLAVGPLVAAVLADPDAAVTALLTARGLDPDDLRGPRHAVTIAAISQWLRAL
ncbi:hypothetical protein AB0M46_45000 [Dactylosporangium sp. NPDC051485]|uniref:hypothetical protein n=1 Tax=Dactylosporangium sp. NPDC051485 TaxID=3154846 RepID=UPI00343B4197